jgi:hypothetical protein
LVIRCTVPVLTQSVVVMLRMPLSPFFSAFRIAAGPRDFTITRGEPR